MRSMGSPDYRYSPWTEERRKRASEAGKARWAAKREAERLAREEERKRAAPIDQLMEGVRLKLSQLRLEQECARTKFFQCKAEIEQLEKAHENLWAARQIVAKHKIDLGGGL